MAFHLRHISRVVCRISNSPVDEMTNDNLAENAELMPQIADQEWFHRTEPKPWGWNRVTGLILAALVSLTLWAVVALAAIEIWYRHKP